MWRNNYLGVIISCGTLPTIPWAHQFQASFYTRTKISHFEHDQRKFFSFFFLGESRNGLVFYLLQYQRTTKRVINILYDWVLYFSDSNNCNKKSFRQTNDVLNYKHVTFNERDRLEKDHGFNSNIYK